MTVVQHHMTQQQHIPVLAGGVVKGRSLYLEGVFLPLVEKGGDRDLGLRLLLLWASTESCVDEISGCVLVPEVISTCKCVRAVWMRLVGVSWCQRSSVHVSV